MASRKDAAQDEVTMPDAYVNASTPAQAARALGVDGKWYRNILRTKLGVHVSKGSTFDDDTKRNAFVLVTQRINARNAS